MKLWALTGFRYGLCYSWLAVAEGVWFSIVSLLCEVWFFDLLFCGLTYYFMVFRRQMIRFKVPELRECLE